jgi:hypothetical protein
MTEATRPVRAQGSLSPGQAHIVSMDMSTYHASNNLSCGRLTITMVELRAAVGYATNLGALEEVKVLTQSRQ